MTNYIEEMMQTAGVKKIEREIPVIDEDGVESPFYVTYEYVYPDFTAEKQLEIIKLIGANFVYFYYYSELDKHDFTVELVDNRSIHGTAQDFTQALAQLTTELMNAGELDKSKVKEILEG